MTFVAALLLCTLPQVPSGGDLKLPPRSPGRQEPAVVRPLSEGERFRRDLQAMQGPPAKVEAKLQEIAQSYAPVALEALMLDVARTARANDLVNLMPVVQRFAPASPRVADELLFQLLSRPLGEATRPVVETMARLKGADAKPALQECVRGRIAGVRRHAADVLAPMLTADDLEFALQLSREQSLDLQLRGVDLLRAIGNEAGCQRLVELLSKDPALAGACCAALVQLGARAVPVLQRLVVEPPIDRGFAYAAFALAQIAHTTGEPALPPALAGPLAGRLATAEALTRCLAAVPLADLLFRGVAVPGVSDAVVVDALLEVVQPLQFVPNLDLLRQPAEERLLRATGRIATASALGWRAWWQDQREQFTGMRAAVVVDAGNAGSAVVVWRHEQRLVRLLAEGLADAAPIAGATEVVLSTEQMLELVAALRAGGFEDERALRADSALPRVRSLQLQVPGGRAQVAMPLAEHPRFDALVAQVQARLDEEAWQLYRHPQDEPDRGAFWRAERRWRDAHPDPLDRGRRFVARAVQHWPSLAPALRARAIDHVARHAQRAQLLTEADGERAVAMLAKLPELGELDLRLLELAAAVPGDRVWRQAVEVATRTAGGGRTAVRALFQALGPDAVLAALHDDNPLVRRAGIEEIMAVRDQRAAARLVELLADDDLDVRRAAAAACGQLQIAAAARPLVAAIVADDTTPLVRRECLRALGRVGGELAFPVLQRALLAPSIDDKEAALRGLGELRDPRAAHVLAEMVVVGHDQDLGTLARLALQRQGGSMAVPALRGQLQVVQNPAIRDQLVLLLGMYQDPANVPELLDLLRQPAHATMAAALLSGTTGVDLVAAEDRISRIETWWRQRRNEAQWQWLLEALRATEVPTALRPEHFAPGAGPAPVVELARLLVELPQPHLWTLCAAVLRGVTGEDHGVVTMQTPREVRQAIAARYRLLDESARSAQGR